MRFRAADRFSDSPETLDEILCACLIEFVSLFVRLTEDDSRLGRPNNSSVRRLMSNTADLAGGIHDGSLCSNNLHAAHLPNCSTHTWRRPEVLISHVSGCLVTLNASLELPIHR